jgi:hypothetical protein
MKNLNFKAFILITLIISAVVWWIIAQIKGIDLSNLWILLKQIPDVAFVNGILFVLFVKWGWRRKIFKGWLVPFPDLNGSWQGTIQTSWVDPKTNKIPVPIPVLLTIKQNFLSLSCVMRTAEMTSYSFAEDFKVDDEKQIKQIVYSYMSKPTVNLSERSAIHEGTIIFDMHGCPVNKLSGQYWTARKTTGLIELTFREKTLLDQLPSDFPTHPMTAK